MRGRRWTGGRGRGCECEKRGLRREAPMCRCVDVSMCWWWHLMCGRARRLCRVAGVFGALATGHRADRASARLLFFFFELSRPFVRGRARPRNLCVALFSSSFRNPTPSSNRQETRVPTDTKRRSVSSLSHIFQLDVFATTYVYTIRVHAHPRRPLPDTRHTCAPRDEFTPPSKLHLA